VAPGYQAVRHSHQWGFPLTVLLAFPLPYALNNSNLTWTTDAGTPWFGQTHLSHDGVAAGSVPGRSSPINKPLPCHR